MKWTTEQYREYLRTGRKPQIPPRTSDPAPAGVKRQAVVGSLPVAHESTKDRRVVTVGDRKLLGSEFQEQRDFLRWASENAVSFPALGLLYAIPNGGHRSKASAGKAKAEGVKNGVPDLHLPVSRKGYLTLYIEMKTKYNGCTREQDAWHDALEEEGHMVRVCYGCEAAKVVLLDYLGLNL